jgi:hypothetical protein
MEAKKLNWKSVIELINNSEKTENIILEFKDNEKILWKDAILLGKNGFKVPDSIIDYDDDNIDCSDIPEITQEDIDTGKIQWIYKAAVPIRKEIDDWIKHEKIDINKLLAELVENFYKTMKNINKNAAL